MKLLLLFFISSSLFAQRNVYSFYAKHWKLKERAYESAIQNNILVESKVSSKNKIQKFSLKTIGYHPKSCKKALNVISRFEAYPKLISYIKKISYQPEYKLLTVHADHALLPFPMIVHIVIKRPTKEGTYPFSFPTGIFQGLKGELIIKEVDGKCLAYAHSKWEGKETKIPNLAIEIFSETLMKMATKILIRKSSH